MLIKGTDLNDNLIYPIGSIIFYIIELITSEYFLRPSCSDTPMLGVNCYPSEIVPTNAFHTEIIIIGFVGSMCSIINDEYSAILFSFFSFMISIYFMIERWKRPFFSKIQTAIYLGSLLALCLNPILTVANHYTSFLNESAFVAVFSAISFLYIFIFSWLINWKEKKALDNIQSHNLASLDSTDLFYITQVACAKKNISEDLLNTLRSSISVTSDYSIWLAYLYCNLILEKTAPSDLPLIDIPSLSWTHRYLLFELVRSYSQTGSHDPSPDDQMEVQSKINDYKKDTDIFWTFVIQGHTNKASQMVARLFKTYCAASFQFDCLATFFPYCKFVTDSDLDFFHSPLLKEDKGLYTAKRSEVLKRYYSYFNITPQKESDSKSSPEELDEENVTKDEKISRKLTTIRGGPKIIIVLIIVYLILLLCAFYVDCRCSLYLYYKLTMLDEIPDLLVLSHNMSVKWETINLAIGHLSNYTNYVYSDCFAKLGVSSEPGTANCSSINEIIDDLMNLDLELIKQLQNFSETISSLSDQDSYAGVINSWYNNSIEYYGNFSSIVDEMTLLKYLSLRVIEYMEGSEDRLHSYMERFAYAYFKLVSSTEVNILQSLSLPSSYILSQRAIFMAYKEGIYPLIVASLIILGSASLSFAYIYTSYYIFSTIKKYFQVSKHPKNESVNIETTNEKFRVVHASWFGEIGNLIALFVEVGWGYVTYNYLCRNFNSLYKQSLGICTVQNISLTSGLLASSILREWQFNTSYPFITEDLIGMTQLFNNLIAAEKIISPEQLYVMQYYGIPDSMNSDCNESSIGSFHDSYACLPTPQLVLIAYYLYSKLQTSEIFDVNQSAFAHLQHLFTTHVATKMQDVSEDFYLYAEQTCTNMRLNCNGDLWVWIHSYVFLFINSYYVYLVLSMFIKQLSKILQVQSPRFIASEPCLMEFVSKAEDARKDTNSFNSLVSLYQNTRLALIIVSDRMTIVSFTEKVKSLFGYPSELLIGQNLELLIPQRRSAEVRLYSQVNKVLNRQSEGHFSQKVSGRMSSGNDIPVLIEVSLLEAADKDQLLIEVVSLLEVSEYEDDIHRHTSVLSDLFASSLPLNFFPNFGSDIAEAFLQYFIMVMVYDSFSELHSDGNYDYKVEVERIQFSHQYFGGSHRSSVVDCSADHVIVVFGGSIEEKDAVRKEAMQFLIQIPAHSYKEQSCALIEGTDLKMLLFPPPEVPSEYIISEMPLKIAADAIPTTTTESQSSLISACPDVLRVMKRGSLCSSREIFQYFGLPINGSAGTIIGRNLVYTDLDSVSDLKEEFVSTTNNSGHSFSAI